MLHIQKHRGILRKLCALSLVCALLCAGAISAIAADMWDGLGRQVHIAEAPQRIVTLPVWAAEMLLEMVGPDRIIAVSALGDDPAVSPAAELAAAVPERVSGDDAEGILALAPDLVVLDTSSMGPDGTLVRTLEEAGLTVLVMASPTDLHTMMYALTALGEATFAQEQAAQMVTDVQAILGNVAMGLAMVQEYKTVMLYEEYDDPNGSAGMLRAYGPGSPFDAMARAAGLINVCDAPNFSPVSKEMITAQWKPDVLIVPSATIDNDGAAIIAGIMADPALAGLPAVQNNRVFAIPDKYRGSTSQYMAQGVYELAKLLYPVE